MTSSTPDWTSLRESCGASFYVFIYVRVHTIHH